MSSNRKAFGPLYQDAVREFALDKGVSKSALAALNVLLQHCNGDSGQSRPGRAKIMAKAGIRSDRTLDAALKQLRGLGVILPIAYATGGRGRATVYAFALPAWTGQQTPAKNAEESVGEELQNPRKNCGKPPQKLRQTPAKIAVPTERTDKNRRNEATPSRREVDKAPRSNPSSGDIATLTPIKPWIAVSVLERHGIKASMSEIAAGVYTRQLEDCGHVVG